MGILYQLKQFAFVKLRILKYNSLSSCKQVSGQPKLYHPLLLNGKGIMYRDWETDRKAHV